MSTVRRLLFVDNREEHPDLIDALPRLGWVVEHADSLDQASSFMLHDSYQVGLIALTEDNIPKQAEAEYLINETNTAWVALVDELSLQNAEIRYLLTRLFSAYHELPGDPEELDILLDNASSMSGLLHGADYKGYAEDGSYEYEMVGTTPVMKNLFDSIRKVAVVDAPVLIVGESGTGKELTARSIHERSPRSNAPFNAVNCAALPPTLIQSELFGHEKGAFTGAILKKMGWIDASEGGTVVLDEIGDLPLEMQVNLLRFLEGNYIQRVGSNKEIHVDVRIVAATNVDLDKAVKDGKFREDLYHRLNVVQVVVPPLRDRPEDIEILAQFFFKKFAKEKNYQVRGFSLEALTVMRHYSWPGNIRELINRIRRAMIMCEKRLIRPADLGLERRGPTRHIMTLEEARHYAEQRAIQAALVRNKYNVQQAASDLGVSRVTLYRLMEKYNKLLSDAGLEQHKTPDDEKASQVRH